MSREVRQWAGNAEQDKLNFLGGKRYCKTEDPLYVALRQVERETGGKLSNESREAMQKPVLVHYSSVSKYVLYFAEVEPDCDVDISCCGLRRHGVNRLEWVSKADILKEHFVREEVCTFTTKMGMLFVILQLTMGQLYLTEKLLFFTSKLWWPTLANTILAMSRPLHDPAPPFSPTTQVS